LRGGEEELKEILNLVFNLNKEKMSCRAQPVYLVQLNGQNIYLCSSCIYNLKRSGKLVTTPDGPGIEGEYCQCPKCKGHN